jgi:hypothetical protein
LWGRHIRKKRNDGNWRVGIDFRKQFGEFIVVMFFILFRVISSLKDR